MFPREAESHPSPPLHDVYVLQGLLSSQLLGSTAWPVGSSILQRQKGGIFSLVATTTDWLASCDLNRTSRNEFAVPEIILKFALFPSQNSQDLVLWEGQVI